MICNFAVFFMALSLNSPHIAGMSDTNETADADKIESADGSLGATIGRILKLLARPELAKWRPVMGAAILLTLAAAVLEIISPMILGEAINAVAGVGDGALGFKAATLALSLAIGLRFLAAALPQVRDMLFAPVSQDAQRITAVDAFGHAQSLSLGFHQTRRTGALNRVIDRAAQAVDYLIRFLAFNIGPTFVRLIVAAVALGVAYDYRLALIAFATIIAYVIWTVIITEWRVKQRRVMNVADTNLRAIAIDTLTNFETVKAFAAEKRETERYDRAVTEYNGRYVDAVRSMYLLNAGQAFFHEPWLARRAGTVGVERVSRDDAGRGSDRCDAGPAQPVRAAEYSRLGLARDQARRS